MAIFDLSTAIQEAEVIREAKERYTQTASYQARLATEYQRLHGYYRPAWNEDQWPEDREQRPGKLHLTTNIIKPAVDIDARLQAKLPRITLIPMSQEEDERARAESAEKGTLGYLEASGWDVWMQDLCRTKGLYGKGILKPFWNKKERRPDVILIEQPHNLRIGWGSSDFREMDWALYEYSLSPMAAMRRWKNIEIQPSQGGDPLVVIPKATDSTISDPLNQKSSVRNAGNTYLPSDYEKKQIVVWDYWYKDGEDVYNCIILQRSIHAVPPTKHRELADIPYIVIENDHEPGSPEGVSTAGPLIDVQIELNRLLSHGLQLIADEIDPAWQIDADSVPGGLVPKGGQISAAGEGNHISSLEKPVNMFPLSEMIGALKDQYHETSGLPKILFGDQAASQASGRALATMIEAAINRLDPKRQRLYSGLRELLVFWTVMIERLNPQIDVKGEKRGLKDIFDGYRRWKIVAPEITPRDVAEHTTDTLNKVQGKLMSNETAMDEIGIDSPQDELKLIANERSNIALYPGDVQVQVAIQLQLLQMQTTLDQIQAGLAAGGGAPNPNDRTGAGAAQGAAQQAQPTAGVADNQGGAPLPPTGPGGVPPGVSGTTLVRSTADQGSQALAQLKTTY